MGNSSILLIRVLKGFSVSPSARPSPSDNLFASAAALLAPRRASPPPPPPPPCQCHLYLFALAVAATATATATAADTLSLYDDHNRARSFTMGYIYIIT